jgi:hypothetical protein
LARGNACGQLIGSHDLPLVDFLSVKDVAVNACEVCVYRLLAEDVARGGTDLARKRQ